MLRPDDLQANASARQAGNADRLGNNDRRSLYVRAKPYDDA
jgi:hypothetical protein